MENGKSLPLSALSAHQNGDSLDAATTSDESNPASIPLNNGKSPSSTVVAAVLDEDTTTSYTEDSLDKAPSSLITNNANEEETNDSVVLSDSTSDSADCKRPLEEDDSNDSGPASKRAK